MHEAVSMETNQYTLEKDRYCKRIVATTGMQYNRKVNKIHDHSRYRQPMTYGE